MYSYSKAHAKRYLPEETNCEDDEKKTSIKLKCEELAERPPCFLVNFMKIDFFKMNFPDNTLVSSLISGEKCKLFVTVQRKSLTSIAKPGSASDKLANLISSSSSSSSSLLFSLSRFSSVGVPSSMGCTGGRSTMSSSSESCPT